jgi:tRNA A37 methylthiotransferase MiaB
MYNIYLVQAQYSNVFDNKKQFWLPYSVGCLWAYAKTYGFVQQNFKLKDIIYFRENHKDIIERLDNPALIFFSNYTWNEQYNLKLALSIKKTYPNTHIVFGGPQTTQHHLDLSFIDSVVFFEGEESFVNILSDFLNKTLKKIYKSDRITDLTVLPSPYTSGVFDEIMSKNSDFWQATIETNRGCPFSCTFCDWGSLTLSKIKQFPLFKVESELKWISKNKISYVYLADANFGIFKDRDTQIAHLIKKYFELSSVDGFFTNWTKNSSETVIDIFKILQKYSTRGLTLATQSMSSNVLNAIKRKNLASDDYSKIFKKLDNLKIPYYTELILGLPEETLESWKNGLTNLLTLGLHDRIDFWLTEALPNSELVSLYTIKKHNLKFKTISNNFNILHSNDAILEKQKIVVSTNTMSTLDMIEGYMYAWMIQSFHSSGFSQFQARLANKHGISYRQFYDRFYEKIQTTPSLSTFFLKFRSEVEKTFSEDKNSNANFIHTHEKNGLDFWNNNFKNIQDIGNSILSELNISFEKSNNKNLNKVLYDSISNRKKDNISSIITELLI